MTQHLWFIFSFGSAILWGFGYALYEKVMRAGISPAVMMCLTTLITLPACLLLSHFNGTLQTSLQAVASNKTLLLLALLVAGSVVAGNLLILQGILLKNATLANLIEISYPVFTFIFAWLMFRDIQLNIGTAFGGLLIFAGVLTIFLKS